MTEWWRDGVVYQVYPRSFADASGDGVGDLAGLTARLDHIAGLGADAIWLTPFQRSPQKDHGYDVSDYIDVDPLFGDLAEFDAMLARAHEAGLRVVIDIVPNHCSSEHPVFQAALSGDASARARFHFTDSPGPNSPGPNGPGPNGPGTGSPGTGSPGTGDPGTGDPGTGDPGVMPNNWPSVFGGPAWSRAPDGAWYLHLYAPEQPDWNWRDPRTAPFFDEVVRFWFDRGVDGLRVDVAHGLFKAPGLPSLPPGIEPEPGRLRGNPLACDQPETPDVYRRWRAIADTYDPPRILIGEVNLAPERVARYVGADRLHQAFAFGFVMAPWDADIWRETGEQLLRERPVTWVVENHDVRRTPTRYSDSGAPTASHPTASQPDTSHPAAGHPAAGQPDAGPPGSSPPGSSPPNAGRARAALITILGLPGAAYLYQGQEYGLPEVDVPAEARQDPAWRRAGTSRDGCRVPLPWTESPAGAYGFSPPGAAPPWLPVPDGWGAYLASPTLPLCRAAIALRRRLHADGVLSADDPVLWSVDGDQRLIARRPGLTLVVAMGSAPVALPPGTPLLTSSPLTADGRLPQDAAAWLSTQ
ncbi:alpha-amylase family glycosyl hydrolase [Actinoplanes sp. GCM10030250]|uniref:alpha-amylase family glycosyl hydrolase n=1 Tax=Actinoplanes sp. GCM10030250 TaxID=3273376 RepID=UPI0036123756